MNPKELLGKKIQQIRKSRGFTQEKLAEIIEMDSGYICKMETGRHTPSLETLEKLANALKVDMKEFLDFSSLQNATVMFQTKENLLKLINEMPSQNISLLYNIAKSLHLDSMTLNLLPIKQKD